MKYNGEASHYKGQFGFLKGFVRPMWADLVHMFPSISETVENIDENLRLLAEKNEKIIAEQEFLLKEEKKMEMDDKVKSLEPSV